MRTNTLSTMHSPLILSPRRLVGPNQTTVKMVKGPDRNRTGARFKDLWCNLDSVHFLQKFIPAITAAVPCCYYIDFGGSLVALTTPQNISTHINALSCYASKRLLLPRGIVLKNTYFWNPWKHNNHFCACHSKWWLTCITELVTYENI